MCCPEIEREREREREREIECQFSPYESHTLWINFCYKSNYSSRLLFVYGCMAMIRVVWLSFNKFLESYQQSTSTFIRTSGLSRENNKKLQASQMTLVCTARAISPYDYRMYSCVLDFVFVCISYLCVYFLFYFIYLFTVISSTFLDHVHIWKQFLS